jgi:hypothetical protein
MPYPSELQPLRENNIISQKTIYRSTGAEFIDTNKVHLDLGIESTVDSGEVQANRVYADYSN